MKETDWEFRREGETEYTKNYRAPLVGTEIVHIRYDLVYENDEDVIPPEYFTKHLPGKQIEYVYNLDSFIIKSFNSHANSENPNVISVNMTARTYITGNK